MSGPLKNPKHERFAQELAKGRSQVEAYATAGYKPNDGHAARLAGDGRIGARVLELQQRAAVRTEITVASITNRLLGIAEKAEKLGEAPGLGVARAALMDAAKLNGLVVETRENVTRTPEQRAARLAQLRAERERIARAH